MADIICIIHLTQLWAGNRNYNRGYIDAVNSLAGGDEQHVAVRVVLDDDKAVAGDGDESLELGVSGAILHHHGPGERAPETGVRREPRPHTQLLLRGEQS